MRKLPTHEHWALVMNGYAEIYVITNIVNGCVYVGSAIQGLKRGNQHFRRLKLGKHVNSYLQHAWNKYGAKNFKIEVVDKCPVSDRWKVEQSWIDKLHAAESGVGYNICYPVRSLMPSKRMSARSKQSWAKATPKERQKRISGVLKVWESDEHRDKMRQVMAASRKNPEFVAKMNAALNTTEYKTERAALTKEMWAKPGHKEKASAAIKEAFTAERKVKYAARMSNLWDDKNYRAKMSQQSKEVWTEDLKKDHSKRMTKHFQDPEYRKKHAEIMKAWWAARKDQ